MNIRMNTGGAITTDHFDLPLYKREAQVIEAVGNIIKLCDLDGLLIIARSTNADGPLWAAKVLADAEIQRRSVRGAA